MNDVDLEAAYRTTDYEVELPGAPSFILRIDEASQDLKVLYRRFSVDCCCFVSASNPGSTQVPGDVNNARQESLAAELRRRSLIYFRGTGRHPSNGWPAESSFLVLGLALEAAKTLGRQYEQKAIVWAGPDLTPKLVFV